MNKKVVIINSSLRTNSNSEALANEFYKGAIEAGNEVQIINLKNKNINFCKGCLACQKLGKCVINDDTIAITNAMQNANVICFAYPIYYYDIPGNLKTVLDRANAMYGHAKFSDIYLLAAAADTDSNAIDHSIDTFEGWASCFDNVEIKGKAIATGFDIANNAKDSKALIEAYNLGKNI